MLLKGNEGGAKFGGGSVTSNRDNSLTTRRSMNRVVAQQELERQNFRVRGSGGDVVFRPAGRTHCVTCAGRRTSAPIRPNLSFRHTALSPSIKRKLIEILQKPVLRILVAVRTAAERTKPSFCTVG